MKPIKLRVYSNILEVQERPEFITSGTVGLPVEFVFDSAWENLKKVAVFRAGERFVTVKDPEKGIVIPWEILEKPNEWMQIGVYGTSTDGTLVIPTLWEFVAPVYTGTAPTEDPAMDPTTPLWLDMQNHLTAGENPHGVTAEQVGAAPSGYGCGEASPKAQNWNSQFRNGFYREMSNSPDGSIWYGVTCVDGSNYQSQIAFKRTAAGMTEARRTKYGGAFEAWEYVNPPMMPGVEYRTTERYKGKAVYTKLVELGGFVADQEAIVEIAEGVVAVVDGKFCVVEDALHYFASDICHWNLSLNNGLLICNFCSDNNVLVDTGAHATLVAKYTKE